MFRQLKTAARSILRPGRRIAKRLLEYNPPLAARLSLRYGTIKDPPLVTVVVPTYNEERFLEACLRSVQHQSYRHFECLIVNDASSDRSRAIAAAVVAQDDRFRLIDHNVNRGLSASRNTGIRNSQGKWITFLDSDDLLLPYAIWDRAMVLYRNNSPDLAGAYCGIVQIPESGPTKLTWKTTRKHLPVVVKDFLNCKGECPFNVHAVLLRTSDVQELGGFDESLRYGAEDWDLWARMMRVGFRFQSTGTNGGLYRQKQGSMVRREPRRHLSKALELIHTAFSDWTGSTCEHGPFLFEKSLTYYEEHLIAFRRVVTFATICHHAADLEGLEWALEQIKADVYVLYKRQGGVQGLIKSATLRYFGCSDLTPALSAECDRIEKLFKRRFEMEQSSNAA